MEEEEDYAWLYWRTHARGGGTVIYEDLDRLKQDNGIPDTIIIDIGTRHQQVLPAGDRLIRLPFYRSHPTGGRRKTTGSITMRRIHRSRRRPIVAL